MTGRHCKTCQKQLGPRNRSGYCSPCQNRAAWERPEFREKHLAGIKRKLAHDPLYADDLRARARAMGFDKDYTERRVSYFRENRVWELGNAAQPAGSEPRRKAGRAISERRMAWCPRELRADYTRLIRSKRLSAAEARQIIEEHHQLEMARWRREITGEAARPFLVELQEPPVDADEIARVAAMMGLTRDEILSHERTPALIDARAAVAVLLRAKGLSLHAIAARMNRDHTSIMHLLKTFPQRAARNLGLQLIVQQAERLAA